MSTLTKVFALLVSALSIFLCGVVVTFVSNSQDWKLKSQQQRSIIEAAQVQALATEMEAAKTKENYKAINQKLQESILAVQEYNADLSRQLASQKQAGANQAARADTAVLTMQALRETIQNMYDSQLKRQKSLDDARTKMIAAQTQMIELTRQLNSERVKTDQLEAIRRQNRENIHELEDENDSLRQKIEKVTVASNEFRPDTQVTMTKPQEQGGVPIRGQITEISSDKAAISVGTSSGVRKGQTFWITRSNRFLGNLEIIHVEPSEAVGRLVNPQGAIATGDSVTTGFY